MNRPPLIKISSIHGAIRWGDTWLEAYRELEQRAVKTCEQLQRRILELETDLTIERAERWLEKNREAE